MAKKKKKKASTKTRRRVGAGSKSDMTGLLGLVGGAVLSRVANKMLTEKFATANKTLIAAAPVAVGAIMALNPFKMRFLNSPLIKGVGSGMLAGGSVGLLQELKVIGSAPIYMRRTVNGSGNMKVLAGGGPSFLAGNGNPNQVPNVAGVGNRRTRYMGACG